MFCCEAWYQGAAQRLATTSYLETRLLSTRFTKNAESVPVPIANQPFFVFPSPKVTRAIVPVVSSTIPQNTPTSPYPVLPRSAKKTLVALVIP